MKNSALVTVSLPREVLEQVDAAARQSERSRSYTVRKLLENALTGQERLDALKQIAAAGLEEEANKPREPVPNASEVIGKASVEGHRMLAAQQAIAAGNGARKDR
jgi:predicted transcriptional regulator